MLEKLQGRISRRAIRPRYLKGKSADDVVDLLAKAIAPEDEPIMEEISNQIEEYAACPPYEFNGVVKPNVHGVMQWLLNVCDGNAPLPTRIPRDLLLAYKIGYERHPHSTPVPIVLCLDCDMVLPNCTVEGALPWISPCPVCGSSRIEHFYSRHRDPRLAWCFGPSARDK